MVVLEFRGGSHFRTRIVCSLLSGREIHITDIRARQEEIGLKDFEISLLRLVDKLTNGSTVMINETGTELRFKPGVLMGGKISHTCPNSRCVSYFLEAVMCLAPFTKNLVQLTLMGVTNTLEDPAIDVLRNVQLPILKKFGIPDETLEIKVQKRGAPPNGGGQVYFSCPFVRELVPIQLVEEGLVQRVRGIAYATRVSPDHANRMVESSKKALKPFITNVFITTDIYKGPEAGLSPGYGLILVAESTTGSQLSVDTIASPGELPEDVAQRASNLLIEEIFKGGYVDSSSQFLPILLMSVCPEDVSKIRVGALSPHTIGLLRHLKDFFGTKYKIVEDRESNTIILSCLGTGYKNVNRKVW